MARQSRRSLRAFRWLRSLLRRLSRWLVGMAERCCRVRLCGHVSRGASRRRMRAAVGTAANAMIVESVVDVGGIAGVDAMSSGDVAASVVMRRRPKLRVVMRRERSIGRSLAGWIRRRL